MSPEAKKRNERIFQKAGRELKGQGLRYGMLPGGGGGRALRSYLLRGGTLPGIPYPRPSRKNPKTLRKGKIQLGMPGGTPVRTRPPIGSDHFPAAPACLPVSKEDLSQWVGGK